MTTQRAREQQAAYAAEVNPRTGTLTLREEWARGGFTQVPNDFIDRTDLNAAAKCVYLILLREAWRGGQCMPTMSELEGLTGSGEAAIRTALLKLRDVGLVTSRRPGQGKPNVYTVGLAPEHENGAHPEALESRVKNPEGAESRVKTPANPGSRGTSNEDLYNKGIQGNTPEDLRSSTIVPERSAPADERPPSRQTQVVDLIRARGFPGFKISPADAKAIKTATSFSAEEIADAYVEAARRAGDDSYLANNLSVAFVIPRINGMRLPAPAAKGRNGRAHLPRVGLGTPEQEAEFGEWADRRQAAGTAFMYSGGETPL